MLKAQGGRVKETKEQKAGRGDGREEAQKVIHTNVHLLLDCSTGAGKSGIGFFIGKDANATSFPSHPTLRAPRPTLLAPLRSVGTAGVQRRRVPLSD